MDDEHGFAEATESRSDRAVQPRSLVAPDLDAVGRIDIVRGKRDGSKASLVECRDDANEERPDETVALVGAQEVRQTALGRRSGADGTKGGRQHCSLR